MPSSKDEGSLDISGEERSYKCFRIEGSEICNFNFFSFISKSSINTHSMDSIVSLSYLIKIGRTRNKYLTVLRKEIWDYLLRKEITITAEYLTGLLSVEADTQSRTASEWKLNPMIFQKIYKYRGAPEIDLFVSRISHQLPSYISWKLDLYSQRRDAFQIFWTNKKGYPFPPFCLIGRILKKIHLDKATLIVVTPRW